MSGGQALVVGLIGLGFISFVVFFWTLVAAYVLKAACRMVGTSEPDINLAMYISFIEIMLGGMIFFAATAFVLEMSESPAVGASSGEILTVVLSVSVAFALSAGVYVMTLRVSLMRAVSIAAVRYVFTASVLAATRLVLVVAAIRL